MMKIGLLGLPQSGRTTIFCALTKSEVPVAGHTNGKAGPNMRVVQVLDERVDRLSELYVPKKTVYATVEFVDFVGSNGTEPKAGPLSNGALGLIKTMDALALVVRNFDDGLSGRPTPLEDLRRVHEELVLSDLIIAENRLDRIQKGYSRGQRTEALQSEEKALIKVLEGLNQNRPIRQVHLTSEEEKATRGFQFLTRKPILVILNSDETTFGKNACLLAEVEHQAKAVEFAGKFEMELCGLSEEEAALFMEDMGIRESAYRRLITLAYETLGYISFFTVGADEVRAWNVQRGDNALDAAAVIHSDLARGFIRAECFSYDDLLRHGSEKGLRERGLFRLEGRDYPVQDGDILNIRFNV
jgi:hypothetical protein